MLNFKKVDINYKDAQVQHLIANKGYIPRPRTLLSPHCVPSKRISCPSNLTSTKHSFNLTSTTRLIKTNTIRNTPKKRQAIKSLSPSLKPSKPNTRMSVREIIDNPNSLNYSLQKLQMNLNKHHLRVHSERRRGSVAKIDARESLIRDFKVGTFFDRDEKAQSVNKKEKIGKGCAYVRINRET